MQTFGFPDPVRLHDPHLLRPALKLIKARQQFLGIIRNLQKPLIELPPLNRSARTPSLSVDHLLVRQNRIINRVPVDDGLLPVRDPLFKKFQEHRLLVAVIIRIAGSDFAVPVNRQSHGLQLRAHGGDIFMRPLFRVLPALDGGIFRRKPERIPPHRVNDVKPLGRPVTGNNITQCIISYMPDMDTAGRVGKHLQHIIFRFLGILRNGKTAPLRPDATPFLLGFFDIVTLTHPKTSGPLTGPVPLHII